MRNAITKWEKRDKMKESTSEVSLHPLSCLLSKLPVTALYQTLSTVARHELHHQPHYCFLGLDEDLVNYCIQLSIFNCYFKYCRRTEWSSFFHWDTKKCALQSEKVSELLMMYNAEAGKYSPGLNTPVNSELLGMQGYIKLCPSWHFLPFTVSYSLALWYLLLSAFWFWQFWL